MPAAWQPILAVLAGVSLLVAAVLWIKKVFDTPSRAYKENVGDEYDQWTEEGVLEYYWGEHIHLGFYSEAERAAGYKKKDFIQATNLLSCAPLIPPTPPFLLVLSLAARESRAKERTAEDGCSPPRPLAPLLHLSLEQGPEHLHGSG